MKIEYEIKGVKLDVNDLAKLNEYYRAACTAEYVRENYTAVRSDNEAMAIGYEVRRLMDKYDYNEEDAVTEVMAKFGDGYVYGG